MDTLITNTDKQATGLYLVHKLKNSRPAHFWTGTDTVCNRLAALNFASYMIVTSIDEDRQICQQCGEVAVKRRLDV